MPYTTSCSFCGSILRDVLDLGFHPHSDYFPTSTKQELDTFPLTLTRCTSCGLYQNDFLLTTEQMFNDDYLYDSSVNTSAKSHWFTLALDIQQRINNVAELKSALRVLDIGSNSGELLQCFESIGCSAEGIEPSSQPHKLACSRGLSSIQKPFNAKTLDSLSSDKYDCICFTNSFPHIPDPQYTLRLAKEILDEDHGVICIESPSAQRMLRSAQYDQIYHQHMTYLDIYPLHMLCNRLGLRLLDYKETPFHNGSIRYYICHERAHYADTSKMSEYTQSITSNLSQYLGSQQESEFRSKCLNHRKELRRFISDDPDSQKNIAFISAPAKGNTILNFCGITSSDVRYASEANKLKIGRFTPLSGLSIVSDGELANASPKVAIILAWNFFDSIKKVVQPSLGNAKIVHPFDLATS